MYTLDRVRNDVSESDHGVQGCSLPVVNHTQLQPEKEHRREVIWYVQIHLHSVVFKLYMMEKRCNISKADFVDFEKH